MGIFDKLFGKKKNAKDVKIESMTDDPEVIIMERRTQSMHEKPVEEPVPASKPAITKPSKTFEASKEEKEIPKNFIDMCAKLEKLARKYSKDCEYFNSRFIKCKNCDMTVKIISELLLSEQSYFTIEEIEERSANYATILYKGTIEDVKSGLNNYYVYAQKEPNFRNYAIQLSYDRWAASSSVIEMLADYNTHMDTTQIYKAENNDYYVTGVLPPYQGSLMEYKRYEDYIPKKLYHYE